MRTSQPTQSFPHLIGAGQSPDICRIHCFRPCCVRILSIIDDTRTSIAYSSPSKDFLHVVLNRATSATHHSRCWRRGRSRAESAVQAAEELEFSVREGAKISSLVHLRASPTPTRFYQCTPWSPVGLSRVNINTDRTSCWESFQGSRRAEALSMPRSP